MGAVGIGGMVSAVFATALAWRRRLTLMIAGARIVQGLAFAGVAIVANLGPTMGLIGLAGAGAAVLMVCGRTLLQRATADRVLSRDFAVQESVSLLGLAMGTALAPILITMFSPSDPFLPVGLGAAAVTLLGSLLIRRLDARAVYRKSR